MRPFRGASRLSVAAVAIAAALVVLAGVPAALGGEGGGDGGKKGQGQNGNNHAQNGDNHGQKGDKHGQDGDSDSQDGDNHGHKGNGGSNVICTSVAPVVVTRDLIVPEGATCNIGSGTKIKRDVIVKHGATLVSHGGIVGRDVRADDPAAIDLGLGSTGRGMIGHDVKIRGVTGSAAAGLNYLCSTLVGHDVRIDGSAPSAGPWAIGDPSACSFGVRVGHDLSVERNQNVLRIIGNKTARNGAVGHDLVVRGNTPGGATVSENEVGRDARCDGNHPFTGTGNTAGHENTCNGSNP